MTDRPGERAEYADALLTGPLRGRGAALNPGNRFETVRLHVLGEHLDEIALERDGAEAVTPTRVFRDNAKTAINRVDSPDLPFSWSLNPYRGCEHGCIYCYARPTHETFGLSCGADFETRIFAKMDAPALLRSELSSPKWKGDPLMVSGVTDAYQPVEAKLRLTRACMELFAECGQPVSIVTKNRLVTRDIDLLGPLARINAALVAISLTTLDNRLASAMEPRASSPRDRLAAIEALAGAGIPVFVMTAPIIPGLTDHELPSLLKAAADAGARGAGWTLVRLPYQVKALFLEWLQREAPLRAAKVEAMLREARGRGLNDPRFGFRLRGEGVRAEQIKRSFELFKRRYGLNKPVAPLSSAGFRPPAPGKGGQLGLFGSA